MLKQILITLVTLVTVTMARFMPFEDKCVPVTSKMCKQLDPENYIYTSFPNFMNHSSATIANKELENYIPVIQSGCSNTLQMFLCTLYVPICKPGIGTRIPPCKSLCKAARDGCEPLLNSAHIRWPSSMDCSHFPDENSGELCVSFPDPQPPVRVVEDKEMLEENQIPSKRTAVKKGSGSAIFKKDLKSMQEVELSCPSDKQIYVRKVRHWPEFDVECCPIDTLEAMSEKCNGKENCTVILDKDIIGAGCVANMNKTAVKYKCVSKSRDVSYRKSIGCRTKNKNRI